MSDKVLIIIGTGDHEKAKTGCRYAMRTLQEGWLERVKVVFFGPGERVLVENPDIQEMVKHIGQAEKPLACKAISDESGTSGRIEDLGVEVVYVGKIISDLIKEGWTPMVW